MNCLTKCISSRCTLNHWKTSLSSTNHILKFSTDIAVENTIPKPQLHQLSRHEPSKASLLTNYMCHKNDPKDHTHEDNSCIYVIPKEDYSRMVHKKWNTKSFSHRYQRMAESFNESPLVIRKPGLEIVNYLQNTNYDMPVNRYLLYGKNGCGKTMTIQYVTHYCMKQNWLIIPTTHLWNWLSYVYQWYKNQRTELLQSYWNEARIDQSVMAASWLEQFKLINHSLLNDIKTTKTYKLSNHESADAGMPLSAFVEIGIARVRLANDVIGCIMKEVWTENPTMPRVLVTVDGVNAIFGETKLRMLHGHQLEAHELSFVHNLKKLLQNTWRNGAVVTALNTSGAINTKQENKKLKSEHPYDVLGKEGFDLLDPHIPIEVPKYTEQEMLTQLAYYKDKKWIGSEGLTKAGEGEILQLSNRNPRELANICAAIY